MPEATRNYESVEEIGLNSGYIPDRRAASAGRPQRFPRPQSPCCWTARCCRRAPPTWSASSPESGKEFCVGFLLTSSLHYSAGMYSAVVTVGGRDRPSEKPTEAGTSERTKVWLARERVAACDINKVRESMMKIGMMCTRENFGLRQFLFRGGQNTYIPCWTSWQKDSPAPTAGVK